MRSSTSIVTRSLSALFGTALLTAVTIAVAGCDTSVTSIDPPDAVERRFTLHLDEVDRRDRVFEVEVFEAPPLADLVLITTNAAPGMSPCPDELQPVCLSVSGEVHNEQTATADDDGEAWWYVPFGAAGPDGWLEVQVYVVGEPPSMSNGLRLQAP